MEYLLLSHCHPHSSHLVQDWSLKRIRRVESAVGIISSKYFTHNIINNSFFMNIINEAHARPKAWLGPRPAGGKGPTAISFSLLFYYLKQC